MDQTESAEEDTFYDATEDASDGEEGEGVEEEEEEEGEDEEESGDEGLKNAYSVSDLLGELDDDDQAGSTENGNPAVNNEYGGQLHAQGNAETTQSSDSQTMNCNVIESSQTSKKSNDETESSKNDQKGDTREICDDSENLQKSPNDENSSNSAVKNAISNENDVESHNEVGESAVRTEVNESSSEVIQNINTKVDEKVENDKGDQSRTEHVETVHSDVENVQETSDKGSVKLAETVENCVDVSKVQHKAPTTKIPEKHEPVEETVHEKVSAAETKTEEEVKTSIPEVEKTNLPNADTDANSKIELVERNVTEKNSPENVVDGNVKSEECAETNSGVSDVAMVATLDSASETLNTEEIEPDVNARVASVTNPLSTDINIDNTELDVPMRTKAVVDAFESVNYDDHTYYNDPAQRVASDISGRFPVQPGSLETAVPVDEQNDGTLSHYYDDVPGKTLDRIAGEIACVDGDLSCPPAEDIWMDQHIWMNEIYATVNRNNPNTSTTEHAKSDSVCPICRSVQSSCLCSTFDSNTDHMSSSYDPLYSELTFPDHSCSNTSDLHELGVVASVADNAASGYHGNVSSSQDVAGDVGKRFIEDCLQHGDFHDTPGNPFIAPGAAGNPFTGESCHGNGRQGNPFTNLGEGEPYVTDTVDAKSFFQHASALWNSKKKSVKGSSKSEDLENEARIKQTKGTLTSRAMGEEIYENVVLRASGEEPEVNPLSPDVLEEDEDYGWSSSEFESYEEDSSSQGQRRSSERELPQIKRHKKKRISASPEIQLSFEALQKFAAKLGQKAKNGLEDDADEDAALPSDMLQKLAAKLGQKSKKDAEEDAEDEKLYVEVMLNLEKHPPPELPPQPNNLSKLQVRRRLIVSSIVESEKSYTSSLRRIIEDYEKPLIEMRPQILSKAAIKVIFHKVREILQCHNMFHIELAEYIKVWHEEEKIGNVFTASFAKSMVFDVYSAFVNNFSVAMEMARKQARTKQAFAEFLKQRLVRSTDKLSLFGLIVKPVQRFPQFIMLLQDLLKHTPMDHHDRLPLQMALTELENLTQKLNETKRDSQSKFEVKKILSHLSGRHPLKHDLSRILIRQDNVEQMESVNGVTRTKPRRLFLFNDQLLCVTVVSKETDVGVVEKFKYKWTIPVKDAEVIDTPMSSVPQDKSALQRQMSFGKTEKYSTDKENPLQQEIDDMQHDIPIIEDIGERVGQLRLKYQGLRVELIDGIVRMLQMMIQQKNNIDKCLIQISLPSKSSGRILHTFQVDAPSIKHDWLLELKNTKLAHDPKNKPGWRIPENQVNVAAKLPLFMKALLIDVIKQDSKKFRMSFKKKVKRQVQCAIAVVIPSVDYIGIGLQHMWVCSSVKGKGQVSVVSVHGNSPQIVESFQASDSEIVCAELVPGLGSSDHKNAFAQDTVWMGLEDKKLYIRNVVEESGLRGDARLVLSTDGVITIMRYMDSRMYVGLHNGHLLIYSRDKDGIWNVKNKETVVLSNKPIRCMLPVGHSMWLTCGGVVHLVSVVTYYKNTKTEQKIETKSQDLGSNKNDIIECMVKAGVGLLVSMRNKSVIHLYHLETFELLQDVNISSAVMTVLEGKDLPGELKDSMKQIAITYMLANKGLLWVGTNVGCILTLPLPRLEGVPQIKGRPNVSYHAHSGPIKFLVPIHCGIFHLLSPELLSSPDSDVSGEKVKEKVSIEGVTEQDTDDDRGSRYSIDSDRHRGSEPFSDGTLPSSLKDGKVKWTSTPDLRSANADSSDNLQSLYGSLLRGPDVNLETEIAERNEFKRVGTAQRKFGEKFNFLKLGKAQGILVKVRKNWDCDPIQEDTFGKPRSRGPALDMMSDKADALQAKFMQTVSKFSPSTKNRCATLPMLDDSTPYSDVTFEEEDEYADQDVPPSPGLKRAPSQDASETGQSVAGHGAVTSTSSWGMPEERHQRAFSHLNHAALSKALIVVSGGDGHINWSDPRAGDKKYEDICLLLWQCKL